MSIINQTYLNDKIKEKNIKMENYRYCLCLRPVSISNIIIRFKKIAPNILAYVLLRLNFVCGIDVLLQSYLYN